MNYRVTLRCESGIRMGTRRVGAVEGHQLEEEMVFAVNYMGIVQFTCVLCGEID